MYCKWLYHSLKSRSVIMKYVNTCTYEQYILFMSLCLPHVFFLQCKPLSSLTQSRLTSHFFLATDMHKKMQKHYKFEKKETKKKLTLTLRFFQALKLSSVTGVSSFPDVANCCL